MGSRHMSTMLSVAMIHREFLPEDDLWQGRLSPRILSWWWHLVEIIRLWCQGSQPYVKGAQHRGQQTCREHARVEFGDLKWHTAEIVYMLLGIEWQGVPRRNYLRVWRRMEENRALLAMMRLLVVASVSAVGMSDRQVQ